VYLFYNQFLNQRIMSEEYYSSFLAWSKTIQNFWN